MQVAFRGLVREEAGQDLIEYGLLLGVITAATVLSLTKAGTKVATFYQALCTAMGTGC